MADRIRKSFSGAAVATTLNGSITSTASSANVVSIANFPNTATGPFVIVIDRGTSSEEKILVSSYAADTLNFSQRGYDGTTAQGHANGATVVCTLDADTVDSANDYYAGNGTVTPSTSAVGDSAVKGTSTYAAAADHKHAREAFATGATAASAPADTEADGTSASPARADHRHARESINTLINDVGPGTWGLPLDGTGAPGATAGARFVGGLASGPPTSGTFLVGDVSVDQTGMWWFCTAGGTPGTWKSAYNVRPSGAMHNTSVTGISIGVPTQVTSMASTYLTGGVTFGSNALTVPVAGNYRVSGFVTLNGLSDTVLTCYMNVAVQKVSGGLQIARSEASYSSEFPNLNCCDTAALSANDQLELVVQYGGGSAPGGAFCDPSSGIGLVSKLAVELISQ